MDSSLPEFIDCIHGLNGLQYYFKYDDTIGLSLRTYGEWAFNEISIMSRYIQPGDCVLDIGCNVGTHTMAFSELVGQCGRVISIDAQMGASALTTLTAVAQGRTNISVLNVAIGNSSEPISFPVLDYSQPQNFGAVAASGFGTAVPVITIDSLGLKNLDYIKMDIEGGELSALYGGLDSISRYLPVISCEILSQEIYFQITELLAPLGYKFTDISIDAFNPKNYLGSKINIFGAAQERLLICTPTSWVSKV